MTVKISANLM